MCVVVDSSVSLLAALLEQLGHETRPAGLVGCAYAAAAIAVEVLIEKQVIAEVPVALHPRVMRVYSARAVLTEQKDLRQSGRQFVCHVIQTDESTGARRTLDTELIAVVVMELLQRFDDEEVEREPDWSAPVGVTTEECTIGFRGLIANR